jgi:hypothetical protein
MQKTDVARRGSPRDWFCVANFEHLRDGYAAVSFPDTFALQSKVGLVMDQLCARSR